MAETCKQGLGRRREKETEKERLDLRHGRTTSTKQSVRHKDFRKGRWNTACMSKKENLHVP